MWLSGWDFYALCCAKYFTLLNTSLLLVLMLKEFWIFASCIRVFLNPFAESDRIPEVLRQMPFLFTNVLFLIPCGQGLALPIITSTSEYKDFKLYRSKMQWLSYFVSDFNNLILKVWCYKNNTCWHC